MMMTLAVTPLSVCAHAISDEKLGKKNGKKNLDGGSGGKEVLVEMKVASSLDAHEFNTLNCYNDA